MVVITGFCATYSQGRFVISLTGQSPQVLHSKLPICASYLPWYDHWLVPLTSMALSRYGCSAVQCWGGYILAVGLYSFALSEGCGKEVTETRPSKDKR